MNSGEGMKHRSDSRSERTRRRGTPPDEEIGSTPRSKDLPHCMQERSECVSSEMTEMLISHGEEEKEDKTTAVEHVEGGDGKETCEERGKIMTDRDDDAHITTGEAKKEKGKGRKAEVLRCTDSGNATRVSPIEEPTGSSSSSTSPPLFRSWQSSLGGS